MRTFDIVPLKSTCRRSACKRRSFTIVVASAVAVSLGLGVGVEGSRATYPGTTDGRIAFGNDVVDAPGRPPDIYSVMPNGKALHRLTDDPAADICPAYSADGKEIAFCSDRTGAFEIWKMKQNGTQQVQVTRLGTQALFPDFSPDASKIAFMSPLPPPFASEIYTIDSEGTGSPLRLTNSPGLDGFPVYSPDGSKIAFLSDRTGLTQVWVMDADGSNPVQLTFDAARKDQVPDWSPDGSKIAYQSATGNGDIYVMNADGSGQTQLTNTPQREFGTAWSPDGSQIAFVRVLGMAQPERAIYVMNADGSNQRKVAQGTRVPAWQPRGNRLYD